MNKDDKTKPIDDKDLDKATGGRVVLLNPNVYPCPHCMVIFGTTEELSEHLKHCEFK